MTGWLLGLVLVMTTEDRLKVLIGLSVLKDSICCHEHGLLSSLRASPVLYYTLAHADPSAVLTI